MFDMSGRRNSKYDYSKEEEKRPIILKLQMYKNIKYKKLLLERYS
jgi:hypothetical protein